MGEGVSSVASRCCAPTQSRHSNATLGVVGFLLLGLGVAGCVLQARSVRKWPTWAPYTGAAVGALLSVRGCVRWHRQSPATRDPGQGDQRTASATPLLGASQPANGSTSVTQVSRQQTDLDVEGITTRVLKARLAVLEQLSKDGEALNAWVAGGLAPYEWRQTNVMGSDHFRAIFGTEAAHFQGTSFEALQYHHFVMDLDSRRRLLAHDRLLPDGDLHGMRWRVVLDSFQWLTTIWCEMDAMQVAPHAAQLAAWFEEFSVTRDVAARETTRVLQGWGRLTDIKAGFLVAFRQSLQHGPARVGFNDAVWQTMPTQRLELHNVAALRELVREVPPEEPPPPPEVILEADVVQDAV